MEEFADYVHVGVRVLDGKKAWVSFTVVSYARDECRMKCGWNAMHDASDARRMLYMNCVNRSDVRCFECVPWGNLKASRAFVRVGMRVAT